LQRISLPDEVFCLVREIGQMVADEARGDVVLGSSEEDLAEADLTGRAGGGQRFILEPQFRFRCEIRPSGLPDVGVGTVGVGGRFGEPICKCDADC